jgi:hypothetical protein
MKRSARIAFILITMWLMVACKSTPEADASSGRTKEDAEAKHAELIRRQDEVRNRYGDAGSQSNSGGQTNG